MSFSRRIRTVATHPWLALMLRLYIGGLFVYASMYKINYTAEFAETIASYEMVPYWGVNFMAVAMPWVELVAGILLMAGIRARAATVVIGAMLVMFTIAIIVTLVRDAPISCGCFQTLGEAISWKTLVRDIIWVLMALHIYRYDRVFHLEKRYRMTIREI